MKSSRLHLDYSRRSGRRIQTWANKITTANTALAARAVCSQISKTSMKSADFRDYLEKRRKFASIVFLFALRSKKTAHDEDDD
jgi:hypothetical protein